MYAIVETGGKQVKVEVGKNIYVEKLDVEETKNYEFTEVLLVAGEQVLVGTPYVAGAKVICECVKHGKGEKVIIFKYRPKKDYRNKRGHRQPYTKLLVKEIIC